MIAAIHDDPTDKIPAPIHTATTMKLPCMHRHSYDLPWTGRYDEEELLRGVKRDYAQDFTLLPVAIFAGALMIYGVFVVGLAVVILGLIAKHPLF